VRVVLAHPRRVFHPCSVDSVEVPGAVAATLIDYDDVKVAAEMTTRRRRS
jgi:hypothetical protein